MRKNKREDIVAAAIRLAAQKGMNATVRQIAEAAGVTEGALYRHFASKEDLCCQAYCQIVEEMAGAKEEIIASRQPMRDKLYEWVRVSYDYFDLYPHAFIYVLLTSHDFPQDQQEITRRQGRLLMQMVGPMAEKLHPDPMTPVEAMSHFTGVMLNVPRLIYENSLPGPAAHYTDRVVKVIWRIFQLDK